MKRRSKLLLLVLPILLLGVGLLDLLYPKNYLGALSSATGADKLDLRKKNLVRFPVEILRMNQLRILNLSDNELRTLPAELGELSKLEELYIERNKLTGAIPAEIRKLRKLKILKLQRNEMTGIPAEIGQLGRLEELDYSSNRLDTMPNEIKNLKQLRNLNLAHNEYRDFPIAMWQIPNLEYLDISYNRLTSLPNDISQWKKLKVLRLAGNNFSKQELEHIKKLLPWAHVANGQ